MSPQILSESWPSAPPPQNEDWPTNPGIRVDFSLVHYYLDLWKFNTGKQHKNVFLNDQLIPDMSVS